MRGGAIRFAGRCFGLTVATGMSAAVSAQTMQTGLLVSTGVSAESNPYNAARSGGGSVAATAELQPQAQFRSATTTLNLNGLAQFRQFIRRYGLEDNYSGNAFLTSRLSDRLSLHASGSASYNEGGFNNFGRPGLSPLIGAGTFPVDGTATGTTLPSVSVGDGLLTSGSPLLTDVTVIGLRTRTKYFAAGAGFNGQISAKSQLSGDLNVRASRFKTGLLSDYNNAGAELRYSRTLNALSSIGLIGSVDRTNYRGTRFGDTLTKSALVSFDRRFSAGWALSVAAGVSVSDIRQLAGQPDIHLTALSVRGQFCNQAQYGRLCVSGSRSPQPAANGATRLSNTIGADYSRRLNENDSVSVGGSYTRTEGSRGTVQRLPSAEFGSGSVRFDHRLGERSTFFASGTASKIFNSLAPSNVNLGVAAGLQIRFGGLR